MDTADRGRQEYKNLLLIWLAMVAIHPSFAVLIYMTIEGTLRVDFDKPILPAASGEFWCLVLVAVHSVFGLVNSFIYRYQLGRVEHRTVEIVREVLVRCLSNTVTLSVWAVFLAYTIKYEYFFVFLIVGFVTTLIHYPQWREIENATPDSGQEKTASN